MSGSESQRSDGTTWLLLFTRLVKSLLLLVVFSALCFAPSAARAETTGSQAPSAASPARLTGKDRALQFAIGAAATLVTVPAGIFLGEALGGVSNNYIVAALPAVLSWLLIPPVAATLAEWWGGNHFAEGSTHLAPAIFAGVGANLLVVVGSILLGVNARNAVHLILVTLISAAIIPTAITSAMARFDAPADAPIAAAWRERINAPPLFAPSAPLGLGVSL